MAFNHRVLTTGVFMITNRGEAFDREMLYLAIQAPKMSKLYICIRKEWSEDLVEACSNIPPR